MPRMDQAPPQKSLIKLLLIADGKVGKSHFAGEAAKFFKTLYIDGDVAIPTLNKLPMEARKNMYLLPAHDSILGGSRDTLFCNIMQEFTSVIKFRWNDTHSRLARMKDEGDIWEITPGKMDESCLLVLDSWTALVESLMLKVAIEAGVDIKTATTNEMRPVYQGSAQLATAFLQVIRAMPCHVIVLAHPDEYQHKVAPPGRKVGEVKEKDMLIDWTKMIAKSTSRPQALLMAKYFTDVAWMEVSPTGTRKLDFRIRDSRVGGGHFDGFEDTDKYSFPNLVRAIGGTVPDGSQSIDSWLRILTPEEVAAPVVNKVLEGGDKGQIQTASGMSSIFAGKKAATA
jgi:hypothetical protein